MSDFNLHNGFVRKIDYNFSWKQVPSIGFFNENLTFKITSHNDPNNSTEIILPIRGELL